MEDKHIKPTPVVVVRPRHNITHAIGANAGKILAGISVTFLTALIAWWLGPIVFGDAYTLGYWQTFALIFFLRMVIPRPMSFQYQDTLKQGQP